MGKRVKRCRAVKCQQDPDSSRECTPGTAGQGLPTRAGALHGAAGRSEPSTAHSHPQDPRQQLPGAAATSQDPPWPPSSLRRSRGSGSAALSPLLGTARLWRELGQCLGAPHLQSRVSELGKALGLSPLLPAPQLIQGNEAPCPRASDASPPGERTVCSAVTESGTSCSAPRGTG